MAGTETRANVPVRPSASAVRAAIAGNPNSGKTSIFNHLTGTIQSVGNWPGVTVSRKEGRAFLGDREFVIIDLPGTYSLTAYSLEEVVARNFLIDKQPEAVINVLDASNLERNLYLTVQLMEMNTPLVVALNMIDVAERRQLKIDAAHMAELLGVPVVRTMGNRGEGMRGLLEACVDVADRDVRPGVQRIHYGHEVETEVRALTDVIASDAGVSDAYLPRWVAVKLIEKDEEVHKSIRAVATDVAAIDEAADKAIRAIERHFKEPAEIIIAERRYGYAAGVVRECVTPAGEGAIQDVTDQIDSIVCHRVVGPLLLAGIVYMLFAAVFKVADEWPWLFGRSPSGWVATFFERCQSAISPLGAKAPLLYSLLHDGVIGGVGGVMVFVPLIFVMFMFVAILEDTGYIARVAFILDRALKLFGLQGKSILAMIVAGGLGGGGCAVPGVMATRTLREEKDRLVTMLVTPLMNCGAKIPVYLMLIAAFFANHQAHMMFLMWALSWVVALGAAWLLRRFVVKGEQTPFVMELPAYHMPTVKGVLLHTGERTWMYVKKAGTIILAVNLILWAAMYFPRIDAGAVRAELVKANPGMSDADVDNGVAEIRLSRSIAGRLGTALTPLSKLAGFDWRTNIALIGGFAAKEVIVGTMGTAYAMGEIDPGTSETLSQHLAHDSDWNPVRALALMIFVMVYAPCLVTTAVIRRESGKWRWALFALAYTSVLAFVLAVLVYNVGSLFLAS
ncbi:MAG: ferrous iron transport protein B [Phycisphaerae bacterium]|nr:ferrous iron transport protein B [Phycisphaerae bacterium]